MARRVARILNNIWEQQVEYLLQNYMTTPGVNYSFSADFLSKVALIGNPATSQVLSVRDLRFLRNLTTGVRYVRLVCRLFDPSTGHIYEIGADCDETVLNATPTGDVSIGDVYLFWPSIDLTALLESAYGLERLFALTNSFVDPVVETHGDGVDAALATYGDVTNTVLVSLDSIDEETEDLITCTATFQESVTLNVVQAQLQFSRSVLMESPAIHAGVYTIISCANVI